MKKKLTPILALLLVALSVFFGAENDKLPCQRLFCYGGGKDFYFFNRRVELLFGYDLKHILSIAENFGKRQNCR